MGKLRERLERIRDASKAKIPPEAKAVMTRAEDDLRASGILESLPKAGAALPAFALPDSEGRIVESQALLDKGPMILTFYRGVW